MADPEQNDETPTVAPMVGRARMHLSATGMLTARRGFSIPHLNAAAHFAEELRLHEERYAGEGWGPHVDLCRRNASAAIILSFTAIEAAIDEAEDDLALPSALTHALNRSGTLEHAQALLAHKGSNTFETGTEPFRSANLLRVLRNGLVHPKAEWDNAKDRNKSLSRKIIGAHLALSPFQPDPDLAFPDGCMSAGVARWAESSARMFIREMRARLGLGATV